MSMKNTVHVHYTSNAQHEPTIDIAEQWAKALNIPTDTPLMLRFGTVQLPVILRAAPHMQNRGMGISKTMARKLGMPQHARLRLHYQPEARTLSAGPLLGVLMSRVYRKPDRPFGSNTAFCKELTDAFREEGGSVFFFTPQEIANERSRLRGWIWHGGWQQATFPVPDVVYNRLTKRKLENSAVVQRFFKQLKSKYRSHVFNEKFLNKTEVFQALQQDAKLLRYLPESHLLNNYTTLHTMCQKYRAVFLKPIRGSLGKGIIRITRQGADAYSMQTMSYSQPKVQFFNSMPKVYKALAAKMKRTRYQIQQGLPLLHIQQRPVDFRALVQKNGKGTWALTSIVARIAGQNHFVSNIARGGALSPVREALQQSTLASVKTKKVHLQLKTAALALANGIEQQVPYHFGEMGVDLAVDHNGKVWLLEINSKPSKNDNTALQSDRIRPSVKKIVQYTRFLSGHAR